MICIYFKLELLVTHGLFCLPVQIADNSEIETEDENLAVDSARNSFSQALKGTTTYCML